MDSCAARWLIGCMGLIVTSMFILDWALGFLFLGVTGIGLYWARNKW